MDIFPSLSRWRERFDSARERHAPKPAMNRAIPKRPVAAYDAGIGSFAVEGMALNYQWPVRLTRPMLAGYLQITQFRDVSNEKAEGGRI